MSIELYDKVQLKDGRTCFIADILEEGIAYIADVDISDTEWDTIEIRQSDIEKKIS